MTSYPIMFSGLKRIDYALMRSFPGNIICKGGAEALQAIGFTDPHIGIVVKIHDGGARAVGAVVVETLRQLGLISSFDDFPFLKQYQNPEVRNNAGLLTGNVHPVFTLRKVA
jgi:L-asparaginase II